MKITVSEKERAFLFRNGRFVRMLEPGLHRFFPGMGYTTITAAADDRPLGGDIPVSVYMQDPRFAASVVTAQVPDNCVALHYIDGRYAGTLTRGEYYYWNVFRKHTFTMIDMEDEQAIDAIPAAVLESIPTSLCRRVQVEEQQAVLLIVNGRFVRRLEPGRYFFWNNGKDVSWAVYDMRLQQMEVAGQEILTLDKVSLRINFTCRYRIVDPVQLHAEVSEYQAQLYVTLQLALREVVGRLRFDELLERKSDLADLVLEHLPRDGMVEFVSAGLKDVVLPGEVRDIMNTVLVAEKKAQANVIARREEVASTRSLLNTAKLMEENTTLFRLKELEYLERVCEKVGSISVDNASGMLEQLGRLLGAGGQK